ncbi:3-oxoacyl-ACP reductase (plasmid) [Sinorhizobium americanum CCGM7]|nr:3-oxoacyl-ACP reductase [Sinorhizobium americanum CCGM7]
MKNFMTFLHNTYRNQGIRGTTILPGETNTPIMENRARPPHAEERAVMLDPHDVARAIALCATLQKGAVIPVDPVNPGNPGGCPRREMIVQPERRGNAGSLSPTFFR